MPSSLSDIYTALSSALNTAAGSYKVAWENDQFTPGTAPYLEPRHLAQEIEPATLGSTGLNQHRGILEVSAVVPKDSGAGTALGILDSLRTAFARGTRLTYNGLTVTIESHSTGQAFPDKAWVRYPLYVTWRCHAPS